MIGCVIPRCKLGSRKTPSPLTLIKPQVLSNQDDQIISLEHTSGMHCTYYPPLHVLHAASLCTVTQFTKRHFPKKEDVVMSVGHPFLFIARRRKGTNAPQERASGRGGGRQSERGDRHRHRSRCSPLRLSFSPQRSAKRFLLGCVTRPPRTEASHAT